MIPKGYRLLKRNEIWKKGDLWLAWNGKWYPIDDWVGIKVQGDGIRKIKNGCSPSVVGFCDNLTKV